MTVIPFPAGRARGPSGDGETASDRARLARYAEALAFYEGDQWLGRRQRGERRLTVNYARALTRKIASYVFPAPVTFSVPAAARAEGADAPGEREAAARRAEVALAEVVARNDLGRLDVDLCVEASVLGDAALKVTWDPAERRPVVAAVDPATLVASWRADDPRRVEQMTQTYLLDGRAIGETFGLAVDARGLDPDGRYEVSERWTATRWAIRIAGQAVRDEPNPYGWIPYVVIANNRRPHAFWGESDLADLYDVCRELNARLSVLSRVLEVSGAPIAVLENVDGSEGIAVGPGAKWELPEGARAYLLDLLGGGGVRLHVDYIDLLYRALHDLSETPRTAFGDSGRVLSGAALEVEVQPLVQRVHRMRRMWDAAYRERNARVLDLLERFGGQEFGGLRRTMTIWPSVLPSDTDSAVRNAAHLVAHGIQSRQTAIASLGNEDPEGEWRRVIEEQRTFGAPVPASDAARP